MNLWPIAWRSATALSSLAVFAPLIYIGQEPADAIIIACMVFPCAVGFFACAFWGIIWACTPGEWWDC